ncbi:unnamed protein product, partial [marine sediment metagenome]
IVGHVKSAYTVDTLREVADGLGLQFESYILVLATVINDKPFFVVKVTPDLVDKGYSAVKIIKEVTKITGGDGGGKPTLAQGGGHDKDKLDEAYQLYRHS